MTKRADNGARRGCDGTATSWVAQAVVEMRGWYIVIQIALLVMVGHGCGEAAVSVDPLDDALVADDVALDGTDALDPSGPEVAADVSEEDSGGGCPVGAGHDDDGDGICAVVDTCPDVPDPEQRDADADGLGDACDDDADGDDVVDTDDNCPEVRNPGQFDSDNDGLGDACDLDADNDGALDADDNCPDEPNPEQRDGDDDGVGDACEPDGDGDGVPDDDDNCLEVANADQADDDDDGVGDACEPDGDGDGVSDDVDNCPEVANVDQADGDDDGVGDACEPDGDGDGVPDDADNCPEDPNADQADEDGDGVGDACAPDADEDGLPDVVDLFPDDPDLPGIASPDHIYANTADALFSVAVDGLAVTEIGSFQWPLGVIPQVMGDIAIDSHGVLYGVNANSAFTCHPETAVCTSLGPVVESPGTPKGTFTGLATVPPGTMEPDKDVLVAITSAGGWVRLDPADGQVVSTLQGELGSGQTSSGDAYVIDGIGAFAISKNVGPPVGAWLVSLDPLTGSVLENIALVNAQPSTYGLAGWYGRAYAFEHGGEVYQVELSSGVVTTVLSTTHNWLGAGVRSAL